jgi:hypothetical protein
VGTASRLRDRKPSVPAQDPADPDLPIHWTGPTLLLDLEDPRLRLRAQSLTQLCKTEREKALACYAYVKRLPYAKPLKLHLRSAREVLDAGKGDAADKATLLVALWRLAGIAARLHFVELRGEVGRGLTSAITSSSRPIAEAWLYGRWGATDTYMFDAAYMAGARRRLQELDWERGFGIHRDGDTLWNGVDDAWVGGHPPATDPMLLHDVGRWHDPQGYIESAAYGDRHSRTARALHWNLIAPFMGRVIRGLRDGKPPAASAARSKTS